MSEITIVTNWHHRDIIDGYELSPEERAEFDYLNWPAIERGEDSASFFRYRGQLYDLGEFQTTVNLGIQAFPLTQWDGYLSDSFFSGIVVNYVENGEYVIVGRYWT